MDRIKVKTILMSIALVISLFSTQSAQAQSSPLCKSSSPKYKEVSERQFLLMKKNIDKYKHKRFALRAQITNFTSYSGGQFIRAYWVGKGSGGVTFGTKGMFALGIDAMDLDYSSNFDKFIEGDIIFAKIIVLPEIPGTTPQFAVCSIKLDKLLD